MSEKVLDALHDVGYSGPLQDKTALESALEDGCKSIEYTKLVNFLTNELRTLLSIDEQVNPISSPEDSITFVMEVSSFLKELACGYTALTQGHLSDRLQNTEHKILLLDYLLTELMAARILQEKKPNKGIELKIQETVEASNMRKILMTLRFPKPPNDITIKQVFQKLVPTVQTTVQKHKDLVGQPAFQGSLSNKQWETLNGVQKDLHNEYKIRREMLLTRLDVTIQSFQWSDKTKGKDDLFEKVYTEKRKRLKTDPDITLSDLLAARDDIAIIEKTSSSVVRKNTKSALNKVIIGQVPDRGGRTSEQAPPPPEMPSWQQRSAGGRGGGRGGGFSIKTKDSSYRYDQGYESNAGGSNDSGYSRRSDNWNRGGGYDNKSSYENRNFDSAGSYVNQYEQTSKRPKTYDSFQSNRSTYADQYVQEEQHNQQYRGGNRNRGNRGRGRSNYNRGGGGGGRRNY